MPQPTKRKKTVTEKQLAANRANAARSTGPRTAAGKARSARNARKHSFAASSCTVIRLEEIQDVARLIVDLAATYQPANSQELFALERIALAQQSILRAARIEAGLLTSAFERFFDVRRDRLFAPLDQFYTSDVQVTRENHRNLGIADGFRMITRDDRTWTLFLRYQAQAERLYRRAVQEFERLRALRNDLPNEPISISQPEQITPLPIPITNPSEPPPEPIPTPGPPAAG